MCLILSDLEKKVFLHNCNTSDQIGRDLMYIRPVKCFVAYFFVQFVFLWFLVFVCTQCQDCVARVHSVYLQMAGGVALLLD